MIAAREAIRVGRSLIGTPYKEMDCIFYLMRIIRTAKGGVKNYRTASTVSLWESIGMSKKYRDLTWRQESLDGARAGMVAFKRHQKAADHVGLVTERGTVLHSSSRLGMVAETPLTREEGWNALGIHRHIEMGEEEADAGGAAVTTLICEDDGAQMTLSGRWRIAQD